MGAGNLVVVGSSGMELSEDAGMLSEFFGHFCGCLMSSLPGRREGESSALKCRLVAVVGWCPGQVKSSPVKSSQVVGLRNRVAIIRALLLQAI